MLALGTKSGFAIITHPKVAVGGDSNLLEKANLSRAAGKAQEPKGTHMHILQEPMPSKLYL